MADNEVLHDILAKIKAKEQDNKHNGDVSWMQLILLKAVYRKTEKLEENPIVKFGNLIKTYPKLAWFSIIGTWVAIAFSVALFIAGVFNAFGLAIIASP